MSRTSSNTIRQGWSLSALLATSLVSLAVVLLARGATARSVPSFTPGSPTSSIAGWTPTDRLIQTLEYRLGSERGDVRAYTLLGSAYLQRVREIADPSYYVRAEEAFRGALELSPQDAEALSGMSVLASSRHQFQEALDWAERALLFDRHSSHDYGALGDAYVELGRYSDAWPTFQKMVEMRPDLSSYSRVSYARELTGDISGAIEAMERALAAGAPNAENTSWARVQLGSLYFGVGDLGSAESHYRRALALFPSYVHAHAGLARVAGAQRRYDEAAALYQSVVERFPIPEYLIAYGDLLAAAGRPEAAARQYALVSVQQQLYQANGVNTDLEMALFDADHNLNLHEALVRARQEYSRRPSIWTADVLAWTLYKMGRYDEALGYSEEARRLGTKDALMVFHGGMINYALGDLEQAKALLGRALSLNANFSLLYRDQAAQTLTELRVGSGRSKGEKGS